MTKHLFFNFCNCASSIFPLFLCYVVFNSMMLTDAPCKFTFCLSSSRDFKTKSTVIQWSSSQKCHRSIYNLESFFVVINPFILMTLIRKENEHIFGVLALLGSLVQVIIINKNICIFGKMHA